MAVIRRVLERLGLVLNENKTRTVNAKKEGFNFLGFELRMGRSRRTGKLYPVVQPSRKALKKIKDSVTALTERRMTPKPLSVIIEKINAALRGWVGYFHYRNSSKAFNGLKFHVEARVARASAEAAQDQKQGSGVYEVHQQVFVREVWAL